MLREFRTQRIIWDTANSRLFDPIQTSGGDQNGRRLEVQMLNNGEVEDLTGTDLYLAWQTRNKTHSGLEPFDALDASEGIFELYYPTGMLAHAGALRGGLALVDSGGRLVSREFSIQVDRNIVDDEAAESSNEFTALTEALVKINDLEANYAPRLNELTAQLAQTKTFHASKAIAKLELGQPATVVLLGDSTTEQNGTTNGQLNHVGLLTNWLKDKYGDLVTVTNAGVSGHNITLMLERLNKDVLSHNPDLVIVCSGINDEGGTFAIGLDEFKKNYTLLIEEIISQNTTDVIIRTTNVVMDIPRSGRIDNYNAIARALSVKYDLGLFDLFNLMKADIEAGTISVSTVGPFLNDSVHPNENGHIYIFERFTDYFRPKEFIQKPINEVNMISAKRGFRHVGGTEFAGVNYVNGYALLFNRPGQKISYEYEGGDFTVVYGATTGTGQFKVFIDGVQQGEVIDTYRPTVKYRESVSFSVEHGKHLVEIECQTTKNPASSSTNLQIQAVIYNKESRINDSLIPLEHKVFHVMRTGVTQLTSGTETTFIANSTPLNVGQIASVNVNTGEITFHESGLYDILFTNRFTTTPDTTTQINYKFNGNALKRVYGNIPSTTRPTMIETSDLHDRYFFNKSDVLTFHMVCGGTNPTNTVPEVKILKIG